MNEIRPNTAPPPLPKIVVDAQVAQPLATGPTTPVKRSEPLPQVKAGQLGLSPEEARIINLTASAAPLSGTGRKIKLEKSEFNNNVITGFSITGDDGKPVGQEKILPAVQKYERNLARRIEQTGAQKASDIQDPVARKEIEEACRVSHNLKKVTDYLEAPRLTKTQVESDPVLKQLVGKAVFPDENFKDSYFVSGEFKEILEKSKAADGKIDPAKLQSALKEKYGIDLGTSGISADKLNETVARLEATTSPMLSPDLKSSLEELLKDPAFATVDKFSEESGISGEYEAAGPDSTAEESNAADFGSWMRIINMNFLKDIVKDIVLDIKRLNAIVRNSISKTREEIEAGERKWAQRIQTEKDNLKKFLTKQFNQRINQLRGYVRRLENASQELATLILDLENNLETFLASNQINALNALKGSLSSLLNQAAGANDPASPASLLKILGGQEVNNIQLQLAAVLDGLREQHKEKNAKIADLDGLISKTAKS